MTLTDFLTEYGIEYREHGTHHHVTQGWVGVDCPWCSPDSGKFKMGLKDHAATCWTCGKHSLYKSLLALGVSAQALRSLTHDEQRRDTSRNVRKCVCPRHLGALQRQHRDYLESRGFDANELVRLYSIQGIGLSPGTELSWRIFIPVFYKGEMVTWTTRSILTDAEKRYISASSDQERIPLKSLLYREENCHHVVLVVEGPFDAWALGNGAVSVAGTAISQSQISRITGYARRIVIFDTEPQAQKRAQSLCQALSLYPGETINVTLETGKDPASASKEEINEIRHKYLERR